MKIDCAELISGAVGASYAHEYDAWLAFFRLLGYATNTIECENVPSCWSPFVQYLGHKVLSVAEVHQPGWEAGNMDWPAAYAEADDKRRVLEVSSTCRPELVHALYLADTEWPCSLRVRWSKKQAFPVTCNGSFFRPEVLAFREKLNDYVPPGNLAIISPCSAEKPYPSALHKAILNIMPKGWHLIIATGVLGLAPQELWEYMPHYDSGVPYIERVVDAVSWYFTKHRYDSVVVYSDFYAYGVRRGMDLVPQEAKPKIKWVLGNHYRDTYENLLLTEHLHALERAVNELDKERE